MATVEVVPNQDGAVNDWYQPLVGDHYVKIDEHPGAPNLESIYATQSQGDDGDLDQFNFENPSFEGNVSSQVVVWTYGWKSNAGSVDVTLNIGGEEHGPVDVGLGVAAGWHSNTFYPDAEDWTELEASGVKLTYTAHCDLSKENITIYTCYLKFTYPEQGYAHDFLGVPAANIGSVNGVPTENIDNINGV